MTHFFFENVTVFILGSNGRDWHGHNLIVVEKDGNSPGKDCLVVGYLKKIEKQTNKHQNKRHAYTSHSWLNPPTQNCAHGGTAMELEHLRI